MELIKPVQRVCNQEVSHFSAAEIKDVGAPIGMLTAQRIRIFIEWSTVKARQCPIVLGEVGGYPVQDHANTLLVETVHKVSEIIGSAIA